MSIIYSESVSVVSVIQNKIRMHGAILPPAAV